MKPMLARTLGPKFSTFPCYVQPKLNGVRALYQQCSFQSRDEKLWKREVLDHLIEELKSLDLGPLILDGELYVHDWRLQDINAAIAVNRLKPTDKTPFVEFHVFDVVDSQRNFSDRWLELYYGLMDANLPHVHAVATGFAQDRAEVERYFHHYTALGFEGIMLRPDGPYEFGEHVGLGGTLTQVRSRFLWKHKQWEDDEFVCIGVTQGEGKAEIGIGALVLDVGPIDKQGLIVHANNRTFKVGTGFSDSERAEFQKNPPIGKLVRVRYLCLTNDGIPFNPSFIAVMN